MRLEDLPPALQKQALARLGASETNRTTRKQLPGSHPGHCCCGLSFDRYSAWEKHSDTAGAGHRRFLLDLEAA